MGFVALGAASPGLLLGLGLWGWIRAGEVRIVPTILLVFGLALGVVAALDVPHKIVVSEQGVLRRCLLRRRLFPWDEIVAFRRPQARRGRRGVSGNSSRSRSAAGGPPPVSKGGLLLETTERRQYLLSLGRERPATYGAIQEAVSRYAPGLSMPGPPYYAKTDSSL